jgi:hypothetical protein
VAAAIMTGQYSGFPGPWKGLSSRSCFRKMQTALMWFSVVFQTHLSLNSLAFSRKRIKRPIPF